MMPPDEPTMAWLTATTCSRPPFARWNGATWRRRTGLSPSSRGGRGTTRPGRYGPPPCSPGPPSTPTGRVTDANPDATRSFRIASTRPPTPRGRAEPPSAANGLRLSREPRGAAGRPLALPAPLERLRDAFRATEKPASRGARPPDGSLVVTEVGDELFSKDGPGTPGSGPPEYRSGAGSGTLSRRTPGNSGGRPPLAEQPQATAAGGGDLRFRGAGAVADWEGPSRIG
jgi:hypothetical protein